MIVINFKKTQRTTIFLGCLSFMNCIACFCHYSANIGNTFTIGGRSVPYRVHRQIVFGVEVVLDLESMIHERS